MKVEELELLRKKTASFIVVGVILSIIISFGLFYMTKHFEFLFVFLLSGFILTLWLAKKNTDKFALEFKKTFVSKALGLLLVDFEYNPNDGIKESVIIKTRLIGTGSKFSSDDYISGKYEDINVKQSDIHIETTHISNDDNGFTTTYNLTALKGRWTIFELKKMFPTNIQITQRGFKNLRTICLSKFKYKKNIVDDIEFNKKFKVYAEDERNILQVLTPQVIDKIKSLDAEFDGKLLFGFIDSNLHICVKNKKELFAHSIFKPLDENVIVEKISKELKLLLEFIDIIRK